MKDSRLRNLWTRSHRDVAGYVHVRYYVRFTDWKGVRRLKFPAGDNLATAKQLRTKLLGQNASGYDFDHAQARKKTFFSWVDHWLTLTANKRSHQRDLYSCERLKQFFGDVRLDAVLPSYIEEYKNARLAEVTRLGRPVQPATVNRELACLRAMLILAARDGILPHAPAVSLLAENNKRDRIIGPQEFVDILNLLPIHMRPVWIVTRETGWRISEVIGLTWERIDLEQGTVSLRYWENKEQKSRVVPLSAIAQETLRAIYPGPRATGLVFLHKGKPLTYDQFSHQLRRRIFPALGLQDIRVHDLRGTFITEKAEEKWERKHVMAISGHQTEHIYTRYIKPRIESLRKVVESTTDWQRVGNTAVQGTPDSDESQRKD